MGTPLKLSVTQQIVLLLGGSVYLRDVTRPGWNGSLPLYAFRCRRHGVVAATPSGFHDTLLCPKCIKEPAPPRG